MLVHIALVPVEVFFEIDEDFSPSLFGVLEFLNGKRVQKLVAYDECWVRVWNRCDRVVPEYVECCGTTQSHVFLPCHKIDRFGMIERPRLDSL